MNNVLAAKILMSYLPKITDCAYKTATEIAIESLFHEAMNDYINSCDVDLTPEEYVGLSKEEFKRWVR